MNILHHLIELVLPYLISVLEIIGIFIVCRTCLIGFWKYIKNAFTHETFEIQSNLANGLAMGLEFKMAAEILRTVIVQTMDELIMLGAVILLRSLLSLLIHYEIKRPKQKKTGNESDDEGGDNH